MNIMNHLNKVLLVSLISLPLTSSHSFAMWALPATTTRVDELNGRITALARRIDAVDAANAELIRSIDNDRISRAVATNNGAVLGLHEQLVQLRAQVERLDGMSAHLQEQMAAQQPVQPVEDENDAISGEDQPNVAQPVVEQARPSFWSRAWNKVSAVRQPVVNRTRAAWNYLTSPRSKAAIYGAIAGLAAVGTGYGLYGFLAKR